MTILALSLAIALAQTPQDNAFEIGANGEWIARRWSKISFDLGIFGRTFDLEGAPVNLEGKPYGMIMEGNVIRGALQPTSEGSYTLQRLRQIGRAKIDFSLQRSFDYMRSLAGEEGKKIPERSEKQMNLDLRAPEIILATTIAEGTIDFPTGGTLKSNQETPGQFEYVVRGPDQKQIKQIVQGRTITKLDLAFKKAKFFFDPAILTSPSTEAKLPIRKGSAEGDVTFDYEQVDQPNTAGLPPKKRRLNGRADRVDLDFTTLPRTITFTGNIKVDVDTDFSKSTTTTKEVVIYLDSEMKLIRFTMNSNK